MLLDFAHMKETAYPHFKGGEKALLGNMFADERNRIIAGRLEPGASIGLHTHDTSSEIVYILSGTGTALLNGAPEHLAPGVCHYCPKGSAHTVLNDGSEDLVFFAVVPQR